MSWVGKLIIMATMSLGVSALAQSPNHTTNPNDPFVKLLEGQYLRYIDAGTRGDVNAYLKTRSSEKAKKMASVGPESLKRMAIMDLNPKESQFVRLDTSGTVARLIYQQRGTEKSQWDAIVFIKKDGEWKIDRLASVLYAGAKAKDSGGLEELLEHREAKIPKN
jgi:hypothetical protein